MDSDRSTTGSDRRGERAGFTLFEILLATALSVLLLGLLSMTAHLYLRSVDGSRTEVEEAALARNVLRRIADDLTSVVLYREADASSKGSFGSGSSSGSSSGGSSGGSSGAGNETSEEAGSETGESSSVADASELPALPGLYGNQYELQIDVSRLPRLDEFETMLAGAGAVAAELPSNIMTVTYYVREGEMLTGATIEQGGDDQALGGLVRRSVGRASTQWAGVGGGLAGLDAFDQVFAPEVMAVEFQYFDGIEWWQEWDSDEQDGLPVAVRIAIEIRRFEVDADDAVGASPLAGSMMDFIPEEEGRLVYRLLVRLPLVEATSADADLAESGATQ